MTTLLTELEALLDLAKECEGHEGSKWVRIDAIRTLISAEKARGPDPLLAAAKKLIKMQGKMDFASDLRRLIMQTIGAALEAKRGCEESMPDHPDPLLVQAREMMRLAAGRMRHLLESTSHAMTHAEAKDTRDALAIIDAALDARLGRKP